MAGGLAVHLGFASFRLVELAGLEQGLRALELERHASAGIAEVGLAGEQLGELAPAAERPRQRDQILEHQRMAGGERQGGLERSPGAGRLVRAQQRRLAPIPVDHPIAEAESDVGRRGLALAPRELDAVGEHRHLLLDTTRLDGDALELVERALRLR